MLTFNSVQTDYSKYSGMKLEIIEPLPESEYDLIEVGPMFRIKLENGLVLTAFDDEIIRD